MGELGKCPVCDQAAIVFVNRYATIARFSAQTGQYIVPQDFALTDPGVYCEACDQERPDLMYVDGKIEKRPREKE